MCVTPHSRVFCGASLETLAQYVRRVMKEKNLSTRDIAIRSGKQIAASYVTKILKNGAKYPSVNKLQGLAVGLGVDEDELFRVARGLPVSGSSKQTGDPWPSKVLVAAMDIITSSPDLTRLVQRLLTLKPARIKALLSQVDKE